MLSSRSASLSSSHSAPEESAHGEPCRVGTVLLWPVPKGQAPHAWLAVHGEMGIVVGGLLVSDTDGI